MFSCYTTGIDLNVYDFNESACSDEIPMWATKLMGFRGFDISNNGFHAGNTGIQNLYGSQLYGCKISNNKYDTRGPFFKGYLTESTISDNVIHRLLSNNGLHFYMANHLVISNNLIAGEKSDGIDIQNYRGMYGIYFEKKSYNSIIEGNLFNNLYKNAIYFASSCSAMTIMDNKISDYGFNSANSDGNNISAIRIDKDKVNDSYAYANKIESNFIGGYSGLNNTGIEINTKIQETEIKDNSFVTIPVENFYYNSVYSSVYSGTYTGTGISAQQNIPLSFTPDIVIITCTGKRLNAVAADIYPFEVQMSGNNFNITGNYNTSNYNYSYKAIKF